MATRRRLPAATVAEIVGLTRQLHRQWAKKGLIRQPGREGCDEFDLVELTVLHALMDQLGPEEARIAWSQVRPMLRERLATGQFDLVYDSQLKLATLADSSGAVADLVRHGRPVRVFPLEHPLLASREAYRRALSPEASRSGSSNIARRTRRRFGT